MSLKLYCPQRYAVAGAKVELLLRFLDIPVEFDRIPPTEWKSEAYLKKHPLGKVPTLETPEGCIFESVAIMRYLARKANKLYGNSPAETARIDQWLEFLNTQLNPLSYLTIYAILGFVPVTAQNYEIGKKETIRSLKVLDEQLKTTKYLAGDFSIADIALIGLVRLQLRLFLTEQLRVQIPRVVEWHNRLFEHKEIAGFFGKIWLCVKEQTPDFIVEEKKQQKKEVKKEEKKQGAKKQGGKKQEKKVEKKVEKKEQPKKDKKKKKQSEDEQDEPLVPQQKKKNPLDQLPKSPFNIDDWKRQFCNAEDKPGTLKQLWPKFDHQGWSLWKVNYVKYEGEGVVGYLTNNLKNGYLQKLQHFRKYTFAVLGVYGVEKDYEIQGVWMWRGTEIPTEWKEHGSYDYFTFQKLDPRDEAVQALTHDYWLNLNEGQVVEGRPVYDAKWFK